MTSFVDANVIVYAFTEHPNSGECREVLQKEDLITDTVALLEAYAKVTTISKQAYAEKAAKTLLGLGNLRVFDFDKNLFFEAIKRNKKYKLKISDLVHYTTALINNCEEIISYDKDFDNLEIKRIEP